MKHKPATVAVRAARREDLDALLRIEDASFASDRLSRRSFRHLMTSRSAALLIASMDRKVAGYVLVLFRATSPAARLYSIAVDRNAAGRGIGRALLAAAEKMATRRGCGFMRLEVAVRNRRAASLYRRNGYRPIATLPGYYADGSDAVRLEKVLPLKRARR